MINLRDLIDYRAFAEEQAILDDLQKPLRQTGAAAGRAATPLLVFETATQRNWLFITADALLCVVDDRRLPAPRLRWTLPLRPGHNFNFVLAPHSDRSGVIEIDGKALLYSKRFFGDMPPDERIMRGIKKFTAHREEAEHAA